MSRSQVQLPAQVYPSSLGRLLANGYRGQDFPTKLRLLRWLEVAVGRRRIVADTRAGTLMALDHADLIQRALLYDAVYEPEVLEFLMGELRAGDVFYDIGANCGFFACAAARVGGVRVIAFEPDPLSAAVIHLNAELNQFDTRILEVCELALADHDGEAQFHRSHVSNTGLSGLHARNAVQQFPVRVAKLQSVMIERSLPPPTVMKIDVEGGEAAVLRGYAFRSPATRPRSIVFESVFNAALEATSAAAAILRDVGYAIQHIPRSNGMREEHENFVARLRITS